jgi:ElaB/YqjD/DUF883 family membrane-anchored ribosome-binding protein
MAYEKTDKMVDTSVAEADRMKIQTADALEEAARKLRNADLSEQGESVRNILHDVEDRIEQFKEDVGTRYQEIETEYHQRVEPVENIIIDHPIPSILVAAGVGVLIGMLIFKARD